MGQKNGFVTSEKRIIETGDRVEEITQNFYQRRQRM